jgi:putative acetyltransferase
MLISHITPQLRTRDLDSSIRFYTEKVGLALDFRYSDFYAGIRAGDQRFHLKLVDSPDPSIPYVEAGNHIHLYFGTDDVDAVAEHLRAHGVALRQAPTDTAWQTRELVFLDDQGHTIYVGQDTGRADLSGRTAALDGVTIRPEKPDDVAAVRRVNEAAFGQGAEADLVDKLREADVDLVSLVADLDGIVGHILFTPVVVEDAGRRVVGTGLAPMAVLPSHQRQGIGSQLVTRGLAILEERGCPFVVVVGHPEYYPRFGFEPASRHGLRSQWEGIPDAAFMVRVFDPPAMAGVSGEARYGPLFTDDAG